MKLQLGLCTPCTLAQSVKGWPESHRKDRAPAIASCRPPPDEVGRPASGRTRQLRPTGSSERESVQGAPPGTQGSALPCSALPHGHRAQEQPCTLRGHEQAWCCWSRASLRQNPRGGARQDTRRQPRRALGTETQSGEPTSAPVQRERPGEAGGGGGPGSSRRPRRPEDTDQARGGSGLPAEGPRQCMSAWKEPVEGIGKSNAQRSRGPGTVPTGQAGNPQYTQGTGQSAQRGPASKGEWA